MRSPKLSCVLLVALASVVAAGSASAQSGKSAPPPPFPVPVQTTDIDNAARNAFAVELGFSFAEGEDWKAKSYDDSIPEGYRLVIETVSAVASMSDPTQEFRVNLSHSITSGATPAFYYTSYGFTKIPRVGMTQYFFHQPTRIYVDRVAHAGANEVLVTRVYGTSGTALASVTIIGHLVKMAQ